MKKKSLFFTIVLGVAFVSCEKATVGEDLIPDNDKLNVRYTDTVKLVSKTIRETKVRSDRLLINHLGSMDEGIAFPANNLFGKTTSRIAAEIGLPTGGFTDTIGGYILDSAILTLNLNSFYGDSSSAQSFVVYEQTETLDKNEIHYSNASIGAGSDEIGRINDFVFEPSRFNNSDNEQFLKIDLSSSFGNSLLDQIGTTNFESNEDFEAYLPGLMIVPDTTVSFGTGIAEILLNSSTTNLTLYYKNSLDSSLTSVFPLTIGGFNVDLYTHNYQGAEIKAVLDAGINGEAISYIQGLAGVNTNVEFPNIEALNGAVILKAELQITQIHDASNETFEEPTRLFVLQKTDSTDQSISDFSFFGSAHFDGFPIDSMIDGNRVSIYKANISDYLQDVIIGKIENNGLVITNNTAQTTTGGIVNSSLYFPNRVKFGGSNNVSDNYKLKLLLKYSVDQ